MGLGKTREVLAFLFGMFISKLVKRSMIIAPVSVVHRWLDEVVKIRLNCRVKIFTRGTSEAHLKNLQEIFEKGGLLITTYETFLPYIGVMMAGNRVWDYMIFDEGHRLKNSESQISKAVKSAKCHHKIVVTGTPAQNCLEEYYNLVNLCVPNLLGSKTDFHERFGGPMEKGKHSDATEQQKFLSLKLSEDLNLIVKPYMLRRTKEILKGVLRNKEEVTVWLRISPLQERLYSSLLTAADWSVKGSPLAVSMVARYICNNPVIIHEKLNGEGKDKSGLAMEYMLNLVQSVPFEDDFNSSSKIIFTLDLVRELLGKDHKILIFSQSRPMLKMLERALFSVLRLDKSNVVRMDGDTKVKDRQAMINAFQGIKPSIKEGEESSKKRATKDFLYNDPSVFLLTTFVGGVGLELTEATRVIIIDPSKNPSDDSQSVDRAFRVGQDKEVVVYRLMACATIEEHTYRQQILKGEMSISVTRKDQCKRNIDRQKQNVLTIPKKGFGVAITHLDLLEEHGDFGPNVPEDILYVRNHKLVLGINNHGKIFTRKENLPLECGGQCLQAKVMGNFSRKKASSDNAIGWEDHAFPPSHQKWRAPVDAHERHKQHQYQKRPPVSVSGRQVKERMPDKGRNPDPGKEPG